MNTGETQTTLQQLEELVERGDVAQVEAYLDALPDGETAWVLSRLNERDQSDLLTALSPENAAELIHQLPEAQAIELLEDLSPEAAADIIEELPSDEQADIVGELNARQAEAILTEMEPAAAEGLRSLVQYDDEVAGGLMIREFLAYGDELTVSQVIDDLRTNADKYRDYQVQYAFVTDADRRLVGVLRLRDLLLARPSRPIGDLMVSNPHTVTDSTTLDELRDFFDRHGFFGVPVVGQDGGLLGIVRRTAVEEALADRSADDYRKTQGIVREELRTMPLVVRARRRLAWLSVNIGLNVIAASVIAMYQGTLSQVIALAVFLPIISDMSGCSGNQAVAVSMRELSLGLVRPTELLRVWIKEISVGMINGVALGMLLAAAVWFWQGNVWLAVVVGVAMAVNTMLAVSIGGTLPLLMRRWKMDPALASGPILTTITDMCGFFLLLSMATAVLSRLTG